MRKHFRPLPIDVDKPLPIYHKDVGDDATRAARSMPSLGTGMEPEEEKVRHCCCCCCFNALVRVCVCVWFRD